MGESIFFGFISVCCIGGVVYIFLKLKREKRQTTDGENCIQEIYSAEIDDSENTTSNLRNEDNTHDTDFTMFLNSVKKFELKLQQKDGAKIKVPFMEALYLTKKYGNRLAVAEDGSMVFKRIEDELQASSETEIFLSNEITGKEILIVGNKKQDIQSVHFDKGPVDILNEYEIAERKKIENKPWFQECEYYKHHIRADGYSRHPGEWETTCLIKWISEADGIYRQITPLGYSIRKMGEPVPEESKTWASIYEEKIKTSGRRPNNYDILNSTKNDLENFNSVERSVSQKTTEAIKIENEKKNEDEVIFEATPFLDCVRNCNESLIVRYLNEVFLFWLKQNPIFFLYRDKMIISSYSFSNSLFKLFKLESTDISESDFFEMTIMEIDNFIKHRTKEQFRFVSSFNDGTFNIVRLVRTVEGGWYKNEKSISIECPILFTLLDDDTNMRISESAKKAKIVYQGGLVEKTMKVESLDENSVADF